MTVFCVALRCCVGCCEIVSIPTAMDTKHEAQLPCVTYRLNCSNLAARFSWNQESSVVAMLHTLLSWIPVTICSWEPRTTLYPTLENPSVAQRLVGEWWWVDGEVCVVWGDGCMVVGEWWWVWGDGCEGMGEWWSVGWGGCVGLWGEGWVVWGGGCGVRCCGRCVWCEVYGEGGMS
jgi:hypothetical protein